MNMIDFYKLDRIKVEIMLNSCDQKRKGNIKKSREKSMRRYNKRDLERKKGWEREDGRNKAVSEI